MADAAKSDEIEDVLSSIRRLVSEHHVPERARAPKTDDGAAQAPDTAAPAQTEALILTPALRVTDPEDPWVPITPRDTLTDAEPAQGEAQGASAAQADPARDEGADWAQQLWAEDGHSDSAVATEALTATEDPQLQADQWEDAGRPEDPEIADDVAAEEALDPPLDVTEAAEAEQEPEDDDFPQVPLSFIRSTSSVAEYEPEEGNQGLPDADLPKAMLDLAQSRAAQQEVAGEEPEPEEDATRQVRVEILRATREEHAVAEPEEAPRPEADPAPEPDVAEAEIADFLAPEQTPAPSPSDVEDLGQAPFSFPDESDSFVDEDALRELIAAVVREELQGDMGVRITRNIRKLVRREIRLALAAQDLE